MDDEFRKILDREKTRRLAEAEATIDREMAELEKLRELADKFNFELVPKGFRAEKPSIVQLPSAPALTVGELAGAYRSHANSPFHSISYTTRENYEGLIRRVVRDRKSELLSEVSEAVLGKWHEEWSNGGETAHIAFSLIQMLRTLVVFGATALQDPDCQRLRVVLHDILQKLRPPTKKTKTEPLTEKHVQLICLEADKAGLRSLALAQLLQFYCHLQQNDVIGAWVPVAEDGPAVVTNGGEKWRSGLQWEHMSRDSLRYANSRGQFIELNLKDYPAVREALDMVPLEDRTGPVVVYEKTGLPYRSYQFRREWRDAARRAGVPDTVYNRESRPNKTKTGEPPFTADPTWRAETSARRH